MVFDFFKKRAEEGVEELSKLTAAASQGRLREGLIDAVTYTSQTNEAFARGLAKSRNKLLYDLESVISGDGSDFLDDLEDVLLQADIGGQTSEDVMKEVRSLREASVEFLSRDGLKSVLRGKLLEALELGGERGMRFASKGDEGNEGGLTVWFVMGANGMGKTTTIGKLAHRLKMEGNQTVLLAACDTFRAAAANQLRMWSERAEVDCFMPMYEGDSGSRAKSQSPSAVLYGALDKAIREEYDTLIVDTSGRLSNNDALTAELVKMKKVIRKRMAAHIDPHTGKPLLNTEVPHETLLVIDAAQGRMALDSATHWNREVGLTGLVLTKLDGSAKGGSVVAVSRELGLPVKLIGVGEGIHDLRDFDPEAFVDSLLGIGRPGGNTSSSKNKDEGKILARRLDDMRKERDARAKQIKSSSPKAPATMQAVSAAQPSTNNARLSQKPRRKASKKKRRK